LSLGQFVAAGEPMRLEGEGLVLREWTEGDLDVMVQLFDDPIVAWRTPLPSPFKRGWTLSSVWPELVGAIPCCSR